MRSVISDDGTVLQQNDYYPYGERHGNERLVAGSNRWQFGGKENQQALGYNAYDFGARFYNHLQWTTMDPMAEKYYGLSSYAYCAGDPVNLVDPEGKKIVVGNLLGRILEVIGIKDYYKDKVLEDINKLKSLNNNEINQIEKKILLEKYWAKSLVKVIFDIMNMTQYKIFVSIFLILNLVSCVDTSAYRNGLEFAVKSDCSESFVFQFGEIQNKQTGNKMFCEIDTWELYHELSVEIDKEYFADFVYSCAKSDTPIVVSQELYEKYLNKKVREVQYIEKIYKQFGINGITELIECRDLNKLWEFNEEEFRYIAYLCWRHRIYFTFDAPFQEQAKIYMGGDGRK